MKNQLLNILGEEIEKILSLKKERFYRNVQPFYCPTEVDLGRLKNEHTHTRAVRVSYLLCKIPEK